MTKTKREARALERSAAAREAGTRETQARLGALRRETARTQITKNEIDVEGKRKCTIVWARCFC